MRKKRGLTAADCPTLEQLWEIVKALREQAKIHNDFNKGFQYGVCGWCGKLVRLDKPLLGALHICSEERAICEGRICGRCKALAEDCRCGKG